MQRRYFILGASAGCFGLAPLAAHNVYRSFSDDGGARFSLISMSRQTGSQNLVILQGNGSINGRKIDASGTFSFFDPTGNLPFPIYEYGHWNARELLRCEGLTGVESPKESTAVLEMRINLQTALSQPSIAILQVHFVDNRYARQKATETGVTLIKADGITFQPVADVGGAILTSAHDLL